MCEFKVIRKNTNSQIMEDVVIVNYNEGNELMFKDILGMAEVVSSALISEVNTINQTLSFIEHPIIKDFVALMQNVLKKKATKGEIEKIIQQLNELKSSV